MMIHVGSSSMMPISFTMWGWSSFFMITTGGRGGVEQVKGHTEHVLFYFSQCLSIKQDPPCMPGKCSTTKLQTHPQSHKRDAASRPNCDIRWQESFYIQQSG